MRFAIGTVIHPKIIKFFPEFIQSVQDQTDRDFHLFIVNDGCDIKNVDLKGLNYTFLLPGKSIIKNRLRLISEICNRNFDLIIFADADDYFENNRVEIIRKYAANYDVISNEVIPFEDSKISEPMFQRRLSNFSPVDREFVRDKNIFGFSNTACQTKYLRDIKIPSEIIAVDWYLFTKVLEFGAKACFTAETNTYYRQWEENIIGANKKNKEQIITGVKAKYFHLKNLKVNQGESENDLDCLQKLYREIGSETFDLYTDKVLSRMNEPAFWWENIKIYKDE